jgi:polyisoprenoid-binding protein YceI
MRRLPWIAGALVALVLLGAAGSFLYLNVVREDAPPALTATQSEPAGETAAATPAIDGAWSVSPGSEVGYRVEEVLFGQNAEAVGRTDRVTGSLTIANTTVEQATFEVDMTTVTSDEERRDNQFNGRIMSTAQYPTATFTLTDPIALGELPADGSPVMVSATGDLTLRGVTRPVTFDLTATRGADGTEVTGAIPVTFADWQIPNPSFGPVSTEDDGVLEFRLVLDQAAG